MGRHFVRNRVSWFSLVAAAALVIGWLTTAVTLGGPTDLAATPCTITATPVTIVADPRIRFDATVAYGYTGKPVSNVPDTVVMFTALPSNQRLTAVRLARKMHVQFDVPRGTTHIGVQLRTGKTIDATRPPTRRNTGLYRLDRESKITWLIPSKAQTEPGTQY